MKRLARLPAWCFGALQFYPRKPRYVPSALVLLSSNSPFTPLTSPFLSKQDRNEMVVKYGVEQKLHLIELKFDLFHTGQRNISKHVQAHMGHDDSKNKWNERNGKKGESWVERSSGGGGGVDPSMLKRKKVYLA
ncbi:hypothetical protein M0802_002324 [Mischocyttarus mexicanus]|nr:hypothetical protein M0802_002324 [Mischocyttarus mexicanus]